MIYRFGYAVRETPFGTFGVFRVNVVSGTMLSNALATYEKEHVAARVAAAMNLERGFEVK